MYHKDTQQWGGLTNQKGDSNFSLRIKSNQSAQSAITVTMSCAVEVYDISDPENHVLDRTETVGSGSASFPAWFVGVAGIKYKKPSEPDSAYSNSSTTSSPSVLHKGALDFKAIKSPSNAPSWPSGFPLWKVQKPTGSPESKGSGETKEITFELSSDLEADNPVTAENHTVIAKCGASESSLSVEVFIYKVWIAGSEGGSETADTCDYEPGSSSNTDYGKPAKFTVERDRADGDLSVAFSIVTDVSMLGAGKRRAIQDSDFEISSQTVTFDQGNTASGEIKLPVVDDNRFEGDEYLGVLLTKNTDKYVIVSQNETGNLPKGLCLLSIEDNDILELAKMVFLDVKGLKPDPVSTTTWTAGPHWQKGKTLNSDPSVGYVPALYAGGQTVKIETIFNGQIDTTPPLDVFSYFETKISAIDYFSEKENESAMIKLVNDTGTTVKGTYTAKDTLQKKVAYESALSTKFTYQTEGGKNKHTGTSTSCLYVSRDTPKTTELFHTVVHLGCSAASGQSTEQEVFDTIWSKFAGNDICISRVKIDSGAVVDDSSGKLYYYGISATLPTPPPLNWPNPVPPGTTPNTYSIARNQATSTSNDILKWKDGRCGAWQKFFLDITWTHNLNTTAANIYTNQQRNVFLLAVKEDKGKHHTINPKERSWRDHAIIFLRSTNTYYDSSYGINYGSDPVDAARLFVTSSVDQFYGMPRGATTLTWYSSTRPNRVLFEYNDEDDGND
jgi:hypothetical protein